MGEEGECSLISLHAKHSIKILLKYERAISIEYNIPRLPWARVGLVNRSEATVTIRFLDTVNRLNAHPTQYI